MAMIAAVDGALSSTISAARQMAEGTERLAAIFQTAGAQLQEVVPDCCTAGQEQSEEIRTVAQLLLAWREVGEVGVVFASRMLGVSNAMNNLVTTMELEKKQRVAEARRLSEAWLDTDAKPRNWLDRLGLGSEKPSEESEQKKKDQETALAQCIETVMEQMESVRLDGRRRVADAVALVRAEAKTVGEQVSVLKTHWRGGLNHEGTLFRLLEQSLAAADSKWVVHDGDDMPFARVRGSSLEHEEVVEEPIKSELDHEEVVTEPKVVFEDKVDPNAPVVKENECQDTCQAIHEFVGADELKEDDQEVVQNTVDFWRLPMAMDDNVCTPKSTTEATLPVVENEVEDPINHTSSGAECQSNVENHQDEIPQQESGLDSEQTVSQHLPSEPSQGESTEGLAENGVERPPCREEAEALQENSEGPCVINANAVIKDETEGCVSDAPGHELDQNQSSATECMTEDPDTVVPNECCPDDGVLSRPDLEVVPSNQAEDNLGKETSGPPETEEVPVDPAMQEHKDETTSAQLAQIPTDCNED